MVVLGEAWTDAEVFKVILNNGFMALFVVWVLFKGEPRYREMIDKITTTNAQTIGALTQSFKDVMAATMEAHRKEITELHRECREERKEIMTAIAREGELNRQSRHDFSNGLYAAIREVYEGSARDRRSKGRDQPSVPPQSGPRSGSHERPALPPTE